MADIINGTGTVDTTVTDIQDTTTPDNDVDVTDDNGTVGNELDITDDTDNTDDNETTDDKEQDSGEFDPDNLDFEETESDYTFGDYNLSRFKDNLNFADENIRNGFNVLSEELKKQGFTQSQVEWLMQKEIEAVQNKKSAAEPTKEQVLKELTENLSIQERRDYKAVGNFLKESIKGTEIEKYYKEAMANPAVFKIVHALYNKNIGGKFLGIGTTKDTKEVKSTSYTLDNAIDEYTEYLRGHLGNGEDRKPVINKILSKLSKENKEVFKKQFGI